VVVLYKMTAQESPAFTSLRGLLCVDPQAARAIDLILCDNSPYEQAEPAGFEDLYVRNPDNPGLAKCYNLALRTARQRGIPWLLLLDQDTSVTSAYLNELVAANADLASRPEVVAICPKLAHGDTLCSPIFPPRFGPARAIPSEAGGFWPTPLHPFNSGATVRVAAVERIGGFSPDFPLDYLDHATFSALQNGGGRLWILRATLAHHLSSSDESGHDEAYKRRQGRILDAEYRFYRRFGSLGDRWLRRLRLLRAVAGRALRGKDTDQTWRMLKSALRP